MPFNPRLYIPKEIFDILEIIKHPTETYSNALKRLVMYGIKNPAFLEHNKQHCEQCQKIAEKKNEKEKIIREISNGFERSRINKIIIKALLDERFDINHLYQIIQMEKEIALKEGNDYPELNTSLSKLKKYRKMAIALNEQNPHWRGLHKPNIMDDIQRCYNERKEKGMGRKIRTMPQVKRLLEAEYKLDQKIRTGNVLDQDIEKSGDGNAEPKLEPEGQEICQKDDEMP